MAIVFFGWLSIQQSTALAVDRKLIRVDVSGQHQETVVPLLRMQPDILSFDREKVAFDVLVTPEEIEHFKTMGFSIRMLIDDLDAYEQGLRQQDYFDHFHSYDQMVQEMEQVSSDYPEIAKVIDIGDSWEKTQKIADRDLWAIKISDHVDAEEPDEAEVLFMGCHHAREIITPEIILHFMNYLVDQYGLDPEVTFLVDNRQLWLIPMVNPDGHQYVFDENIWWRKNRRNNGDGSYGVDLNRNYGYGWGYDNIGSSPSSWGETYRGQAPFSEPETQAIRDLVEAHTFIISLSYHSYGNVFLFPWGYIAEHTPDHQTFVAIGDSATIFNGYFAGNTAMGAIYVTNGDSDDWLYGEQTTKFKVFGFTPEVGGNRDGFHPDTSRILPLIEENLWPNLYAARVAERYAPRPEIHHVPLKDTEDIAGPYLLSIEIATPVYPLDQGSPKVYFNTTGQPPFDSTSLAASGEAGLYVGQIPSQGEDVTVYYYFSAKDTIPRTGYAPAGAPDSLYSFHVGPDMVLPHISHSQNVHHSIHHLPVPIRAYVTDNLGLSQVWLFYRVNDGALDSTRLSAHHQDLFVGHIDWDSPALGDFVDYWIVAIDSSVRSNTTFDPEFGSHTFLLIESLSYDFEADDGAFTTGEGGDWEWGIPTTGPGLAHSGEKVWGTRLHEPYSDLSDSRLDSPPIDLSGYAAATLTFFHWYRTESGFDRVLDGGNVGISVDGEPFEVIFPEGGYDDIILPTEGNPLVGQPAFGGSSGNGDFWHEEVFCLSPHVEHSVRLRFHFGSNATATDPGWYIDDMAVRFARSRIPTFWRTTQVGNSDDTVGPYVVFTSVVDDEAVQGAQIFYRPAGSVLFDSLDMVEVIPYLFRTGLPGQPLETVIHYYVRAEDDSGNAATDPPGAPDSTFRFSIVRETGVDDMEGFACGLPEDFHLFQNYPNPFNLTTTIRYSVLSDQAPLHTTLKVYNILGQEVRTVVDEMQPAGTYSVTWDGKNTLNGELPTGIYLYRLESGSFRGVKKMLLLK
jgi:hypothetical protein